MGGEGFTIANALDEAGIQIHTLPSHIPNLSSKKTKKSCHGRGRVHHCKRAE